MSGGNSEDGTPNLTPILDMVFQLITFFMLVINFKSAEMDMTLKLPVVGSARPVDRQGRDTLLMLNVHQDTEHPDGCLMVMGNPFDIDTHLANERIAAKLTKQDVQEGGKEVPNTIAVIRCDRNTPFRVLNHVITACQENGIRTFALKALSKEPPKEPGK
jgi:biopolymer transport protein ExbD